jgi:hypothetical protein
VIDHISIDKHLKNHSPFQVLTDIDIIRLLQIIDHHVKNLRHLVIIVMMIHLDIQNVQNLRIRIISTVIHPIVIIIEHMSLTLVDRFHHVITITN